MRVVFEFVAERRNLINWETAAPDLPRGGTQLSMQLLLRHDPQQARWPHPKLCSKTPKVERIALALLAFRPLSTGESAEQRPIQLTLERCQIVGTSGER